MPDTKAGSWAALNGAEFINSQRTIAYIHNFGLPISISDECWCGNIQDLLGSECGPVTGYNYPSTDQAPWYDPAIPESGDFLGFLPVEFSGIDDSPFSRDTFGTLNNGALLGKLRAGPKTLTWKGYLFGRTCCAAEFGLRWLLSELVFAGGCDGCDGARLDILLCCPETTGQAAATSTSCSKPAGVIPPIGTSLSSDAFRTFYRVGLGDGPKKTSERTIGCGSCEDQGGGCMLEIEFSLIAGNPYLHKDPVLVCQTSFPSCGNCPGDADQTFWKKINTTSYPASVADAALCENLLDCIAAPVDCIADPNCPVTTPPSPPKFEDPCGCDPYNTSKFCCEISNDIYGEFFEGVPQIKVYSGSLPLHNVQIKFFENPQERHCNDASLFDVCNLCDSITIRYIPAHSTLTLDGLTRTINIECPGNNVQSAESLVVSTFRWPTLKCVGYIVTIEADCNWPVATDTQVTLCVIPRQA